LNRYEITYNCLRPGGCGKSTLAKAITSHLKNGASFDAENILQVNPFEFNDKFQSLAIKNSVSLIHNFYEAGFETIVAGSFISDRGGYDRFRKLLTVNPNIIVVMLTANKSTRDERIITREKSVTVTISLTVSGGKIVTVTLFPEYSSDIAPEL
jgi:hypothetical protein